MSNAVCSKSFVRTLRVDRHDFIHHLKVSFFTLLYSFWKKWIIYVLHSSLSWWLLKYSSVFAVHNPALSLKKGSFNTGCLLPVLVVLILSENLSSKPWLDLVILEILIEANICNLCAVPSANSRISFWEIYFTDSNGVHSSSLNTGSSPTSNHILVCLILFLSFNEPL